MTVDTWGPPSKYDRFTAGKCRKPPERLSCLTPHLITEETVAHSPTICWGVKVQPKSRIPHSSCILFSIHKRWGSSRIRQNRCECGCSGSREGEGLCYSTNCLFFPLQGPAREWAYTNSNQWPGILGIYVAILEEDDPLPCLRDQASPTLLGLASSSPCLPFCLYGQCPHLFQPFPQTSLLLPHKNCHIPPPIQLAKRANSNLGRPVYGHRGFHLEAGRYHLSKPQSPFRIQLKSHSILQESPLISSHVRHLASHHPFPVG